MALRKPSRRFVREFGSASGVSTKERTRLIALVFVMAVVTVAMLGGLDQLFAGMRRKPASTAIPGEPGAATPIEIGVQVEPWRFDPAYLESRISEKSGEDRVKEYPEALLGLAQQVRLRPHGQFLVDPEYRDARGFLTPKAGEVLAEPTRFRAKPVEFNGTLIDAVRVDTKSEFGVDLNFEYASQWTGVMRLDGEAPDDPGRLLTFLFLDDGAGEDPRKEFLNRRVKLQGVFYRLRDIRSDDRYETTLFVLGKKLVRALSISAPTVPIDELAARIDDESPERQAVVYDDEFYDVFGYAFLSGPEALARRGEPRRIEGSDGWNRAAELRLANVRLHGVVLRVAYEPFEYGGRAFELVRKTDAPCTGWYTTYVADTRAEGLYVVGTMERPEGLQKGAEVELDAVYFRRLVFLNQGTAKPGEAPPGYDPAKHGRTKAAILFSPSPLRLVAPPPQEDRSLFRWTLLAVSVVAAAGIAFFVARDRRLARELGVSLRRRGGESFRARGGIRSGAGAAQDKPSPS
jgi:hypothetical protein